MQTLLPSRSLIVKDKLDNIVKEILKVTDSKVAMIILFGSYARGNWVRDEYIKDHITYSYHSDIDILVIMRKGKYLNIDKEKRISNKINIRSLQGLNPNEIWTTCIFESIDYVNKKLEQGHYFYSDIKKEGILLYDSGDFLLAEHKDLPWGEKKEIARKDYEHWFGRGVSFFIDTQNAFKREDFSKSAFELHQATESFYNCILLVFSGYKPKLHDIRKIGSLASNYSKDLWGIFPQSNSEQKECFNLLERAYIEARYEKDYFISKEQLIYLIKRVEKLQEITERICLTRIS
jgi:HEPN domain-containing protein/predicted nucleotidyltransferase